ncbi:ABC transporter substrate-binding protein [Micromonospora sp. 4G57]|uniref:ABC transporter substrate-binding protein n=1 Tax=Micromonospora sicca TaxID=2202420 RepID=A0ABU5J5Z2_9ACTN|nr:MULTISPECIES: ABC transporter substrate-binding protein [unclassified Micromonospora]MDZ5443487.1 ABC transporter substrate-binding protein [Micromonospora sp. 4G57]MDZ5488013.1 ABC transporter substrate-binding protein [Micromonospora sp. 4G53]
MLRKQALRVVIGLATLSVALTGCGRSTSGQTSQAGGSASVAADAKATDLVPAALKEKGVLRVATAEGYPPMEMYKEGTQDLIGVDPELAAAIAGRLGLKLEMTNASFPGLIPGLQADRWDLAMSSMSDTEERRKAVDFVDYFQAGGAIMVAKGNPAGVKDLADLCGRAVVLAKGSSNLAIGEGQNAKCGKKMTISQSEDAPTGLLQIDAGRAVATIVDYPVAKMLAQESGKYEVLEAQYEAGPWGIAIDKKDSQLRDAVRKALQELIDSGEYAKIMEKWGVQGSAVKAATVNAQQ